MKGFPRVRLACVFILVLLLEVTVPFQARGATGILITNFYPCDALGIPQNSFPKRTTAYFNISVKNAGEALRNVSMCLTVQDVVYSPIGTDQFNTTLYTNASTFHILSIVIPKCAFVGLATAYVSVFADGIAVASANTQFTTEPEDVTPPAIGILSPQKSAYSTPTIPLTFTVNERASWLACSLGDSNNATITGNTTLTGLAYGSYRIAVYANDTSGNMGNCESYFTVSIVHDVAVMELRCSSARVYIGQAVNVSVVVRNHGTAPETFNVIAYANASAFSALAAANLAPGNQITLVFSCGTSSFSYGNYTFTAVAGTIQGEVDTADNKYKGGLLRICIPGDVNANGLVDCDDLGILAGSWGASSGESNFVPEADINGDCTTDSADLGMMMAHWGETE